MVYLINYLGIGGIEESETHRGSPESLAEQITIIEEHAGHSLTVTDDATGSVVYECGGFVVSETTVTVGVWS